MFYLFYLQVEPVFLPACLNKAIQITYVSSISATITIYCNIYETKLITSLYGCFPIENTKLIT